jgi:hypothetical protein
MTTLLITHEAGLNHLTPSGHPERPDRLRAVARALEAEKFQPLLRVTAPQADEDSIALCHPRDFVEELRDATPTEGLVRIDADTVMSSGSYEAAARAVGGAMLAVDEVLAKKADNASSPCARPAITPRRCGRWASACSIPSPSRRAMPASGTASSASPSSISTSTTATARRRSSGRTRT